MRIVSSPTVTNGLVGRWTFDDRHVDPPTVYDQSGAGNHGTAINSPTFGAPGPDAEALYIETPSNDPLVETPPNDFDTFSVCIWFNADLDSSANNFIRIAASANTGQFSDTNGWTVSFSGGDGNGNYTPLFMVGDGTDDGALTHNPGTSSDYADGQWHHFAGTFDGDKSIIFLDGEQVSQKDTTADGRDTLSGIGMGNNITIGNAPNNATTKTFPGMIDEVRYYSRPLTPTEVSTIYNFRGIFESPPKQYHADRGAYFGIPELQYDASASPARYCDAYLRDGLIGYWSFEPSHVDGTTALDASGYGNDGTIDSANFTDGRVGRALSATSGNDFQLGSGGNHPYEDNTSPTNIDSQQFALTCWFKPNSTPASGTRWGICGLGGGNDGLAGKIDDAGNFMVEAASGGTSTGTTSSTNVVGGWHHMVAQMHDDGSYDGYIDGERVINAPGVGVALNKGNPLRAPNPYTFDTTQSLMLGSLDALRIYSRTLYPAEITRLYEQGRKITPPSS